MYCFCFVIFLFIPIHAETFEEVRLGLDGNIQFGPFEKPLQYFTPERSYLYARANSSNEEEGTHKKHKKKHDSTSDTVQNKVSQLHGVRKFIVLIYKKNMDIFEDIKRKIHPPLRPHIDLIKKEYTDKFIEFVNATQHHNVKTKSGSQKVIMNTINVSDNIVRRLIENLVLYMNKRGILRSTVDETERLFESELDKERLRHYQNACDKLNICKINQSFSKFNVEIFTRIIRADNDKVKQAMDSLIETLKENKLKDIIGDKEKRLHEILQETEQAPPDVMRTRFFLLKNVINNRYRPLTLFKDSDKRMVKRTVAFTDLIELMDRILPPNKSNTAEFDDILLRIGQWANNFTNDIQETMRSYIKMYIKTYKNADDDTQRSMRNLLKKIIA